MENPKDLEILIDYYKCTCFGLVIDWLNGGMQEESAKEIRKIFHFKKDAALEIAQMLQDQV